MTAVEYVDVLIIGAGLSGIGAACQLRRQCPGKTFAIVEARDAIGGTWDLFRYPGVRSDSDMFTLGFSFRPWSSSKAIADGPAIREYIRDTAREYDLESAIRFGHRVVRADWSSADARWTVSAEDTGTGRVVQLSCAFLFSCTGYYNYDQGHEPVFAGQDEFHGQIVHPQHWPDDLDFAGQRVVVIGSGATAVTLVPAMADQAKHVTMVQRSPSYVLSLPSVDVIADGLRRVLPAGAAHSIIRWKNVLLMTLIYQLSQRAPKLMRRLLRKAAAARLPEGYELDTHFNPRYDPWDQRLCFVPDGDLFKTVRAGRASIVTGEIERFTPGGLRMASGQELDADLIITATGLRLLVIGGVQLTVDGVPVDLADTVAYKGLMISGVPNLALAIGYTNASWTLKCDLIVKYVCRLLNYMDAHDYQVVMPQSPTSGRLRPLIDLQSGYILRGIDKLPKQGSAAPWRVYQNYLRDVYLLRRGPVSDAGVRFDGR
ncbi:MAG TPA: NAD(P)/FAD-dependent oxidoreductase [Jatrophihabitantaceae bacterium]|jgi:cation diffusion facilitator CzcD-associated flavoprotein CzcO